MPPVIPACMIKARIAAGSESGLIRSQYFLLPYSTNPPFSSLSTRRTLIMLIMTTLDVKYIMISFRLSTTEL